MADPYAGCGMCSVIDRQGGKMSFAATARFLGEFSKRTFLPNKCFLLFDKGPTSNLLRLPGDMNRPGFIGDL